MKNKLFIAALVTSLLASSAVVKAEDTTQQATEAGTKSATVEYSQDSSFTITIPKTIVISTETKSAEYSLTVVGDVKGSEKVTIVPDTTVVMSDAKGKDPVNATVTQTKTEFTWDEVVTPGTSTTGTITATDLTAGVWTGTLNFTIGLAAVSEP